MITELEDSPRGIYTGAIGLASPTAGLEFERRHSNFRDSGGQIALGVDGGITADSEVDTEWQECLHKAAPLEHLLVNT